MSQRPRVDGPACWLDADLPTVAENLALDEALLADAHDGLLTGHAVRVWMAREPTVVLGSSSHVEQEIDLDACRSRGVQVLRRPSGGLTVVLGPGCVMWSVIAPLPEAVPSIERIHAVMLDPLCAALGAAGRPVIRRGSSDLAIAVDGIEKKVSGNALRVRRQAVLYHGTLLDDFDLGLISQVLRHPPREPGYRAGREHADFVANLGLGRGPLEAAVRRAFGAGQIRHEWPRERVAALVRDRYLDVTWTHRLP
ncbi:MAG: lipoate--protein ligase family protein [Planctomycetia bacterium]|nr:lipoate--protein ligase family protein [Planctomycetia bacterium]